MRAAPAGGTAPDSDEPLVRRSVTVEVDATRFDVAMWVPAVAAVAAGAAKPRRRAATAAAAGGGGTGKVSVPMQGTVVKIPVEVGDHVEAGDTVLVLEAMKIENNIAADVTGTITEINVAAGDSVGGGDVVVVIDPD